MTWTQVTKVLKDNGSLHCNACHASRCREERPYLSQLLWMVVLLSAAFACGCGGSAGTSATPTSPTTQTAAPTISTTTAQNGAVVVTMSSNPAGAVIYYTVDGSTPTTSSTHYLGPFLVASNLTVQAIAQAGNESASNVTSQTLTLNIPSGTLVWSDEFTNNTAANMQPNPAVWKYITGADGTATVDTLCAYGSNTSPCSTASPNAFVGTDGYLHIVAQQPSPGVYTAARMQSQGLFSFQYGRLEARMQVPEGQGLHPAFWLEGNNAALVGWPGCGEMDVMERINAAGLPPIGTQSNPLPGTSDWNEGSIHGTGFTGSNLGETYDFTGGETASGWHTYGMIKKPNSISFYVDDPTAPYATFSSSSISGLAGSVWPFDNGQASYIILNVSVGGTWSGPPNSSTVFPATMLVDYVRIYAN